MTAKHKAAPEIDMPFEEAVARFAQTVPAELFETLAADVIKGRERVERRIAKARREIEDGARPKKGRFRL